MATTEQNKKIVCAIVIGVVLLLLIGTIVAIVAVSNHGNKSDSVSVHDDPDVHGIDSIGVDKLYGYMGQQKTDALLNMIKAGHLNKLPDGEYDLGTEERVDAPYNIFAAGDNVPQDEMNLVANELLHQPLAYGGKEPMLYGS